LKRILAILPILFLLTTSMVSRAGYCFYVIPQCTTSPPVSASCCQLEASTQSTNCCGDTDENENQATNACSRSVETNDLGNCEQKEDCRTICYRLLPSLLAEGPNRLILPSSDQNESSFITTHSIFIFRVNLDRFGCYSSLGNTSQYFHNRSTHLI
jgi:hypothetical protein